MVPLNGANKSGSVIGCSGLGGLGGDSNEVGEHYPNRRASVEQRPVAGRLAFPTLSSSLSGLSSPPAGPSSWSCLRCRYGSRVGLGDGALAPPLHPWLRGGGQACDRPGGIPSPGRLGRGGPRGAAGMAKPLTRCWRPHGPSRGPCVLLVRGAGATRPVVALCSHGPGVTSERRGIECRGPLFSSARTSEGAARDSCPGAGRPAVWLGKHPVSGCECGHGLALLAANTVCCLPGTLRARSRYLPFG